MIGTLRLKLQCQGVRYIPAPARKKRTLSTSTADWTQPLVFASVEASQRCT